MQVRPADSQFEHNVLDAALETGWVDIAVSLVSRFISRWGIETTVILVPIYQAEICE